MEKCYGCNPGDVWLDEISAIQEENDGLHAVNLALVSDVVRLEHKNDKLKASYHFERHHVLRNTPPLKCFWYGVCNTVKAVSDTISDFANATPPPQGKKVPREFDF